MLAELAADGSGLMSLAGGWLLLASPAPPMPGGQRRWFARGMVSA